MISGVCGGLAEYFTLDPSLVRIGWIVFSLAGGAGVLAYLIAVLVVSEKPLDLIKCPNCGEVNQSGQFCRNCGTKL